MLQPTIPPPPTPSPLKPVKTNTSAVFSNSSPITTTGSGSLYHLCHSVLDRLSCIEGMSSYIEAANTTTDPLSKLTLICRQGYPLCTLYNALQHVKTISVETDPNLNARNSCKSKVYHFLVACRNDLLFPEEDMFTISDLYQDDTNGFVKVVNTINKILQLLEDRGIIAVHCSNRNSDPNAPKNTRDKVVLELLETERKYVQDMEILQNYMRELQIQKVVSPDTIHYLFGNLNSLVDFQRRFLIQLEETAEKAPQQQRVGLLFSQMEEAFAVYEPYCANYYSAQDLVVQETPRLQQLATILNPTYELPSMLIKPVQRICKYPLLLQELVKSTDKDWPYYSEAQSGLEAIKRVTEKVNETQRQHENLRAVQELKKRLDNSETSLPLDGYGTLRLQDKLTISISENNHDREFFVFLFDRQVLMCKEYKGNTLLAKSNTLSKKKRRGSLVPKLMFPTWCMTIQNNSFKNGVWSLQTDVKGDSISQLTLKFRNEEQLKLWSSALSKAIQKAVDEMVDIDQMAPFTAATTASSTYSDYEEECEEEFFDDDEEEDVDYRSISKGKALLLPQTTYHHRYHNMPGMNLSPLPRTYPISTNHLPATPPPSYPSSPTASAKITNNNYYDNQHIFLKTGRSQSQSAAIIRQPSLPQNRLRSKSSPNIMKVVSSNKTLNEEDVKIKLIFQDNAYAIHTFSDVSYVELMEKVDKKIRLVANLKPTDTLRLKYQDEDGDYITINSNDDVQMAFESRPTTLFVSL